MTETRHTPGPNDIVFTQYLMPNGRRDTVWIERPGAVVAKAKAIQAAGYRFVCEMLGDYRSISLTITDDKQDHAGEVVPNGPEVPEAIDRMVLNFDLAKAEGQQP